MVMNAEDPFYSYGTNPLLLLAVYNNWLKLSKKWNCDGVPYKKNKDWSSCSTLHWSGSPKPWVNGAKHVTNG
eukprot:UN02425